MSNKQKQEKMKAIITNANIKRGNGYGQYIVTGTVNGVEVTAHTTNSEAFDWFDDDSNEEKHIDAIDYVNSLLERTYENQ
jgi:hypothetical protein